MNWNRPESGFLLDSSWAIFFAPFFLFDPNSIPLGQKKTLASFLLRFLEYASCLLCSKTVNNNTGSDFLSIKSYEYRSVGRDTSR